MAQTFYTKWQSSVLADAEAYVSDDFQMNKFNLYYRLTLYLQN